MKHTIFDHEIDTMREALDYLFCPNEDGKYDHRSAYQCIHYILENLKERQW